MTDKPFLTDFQATKAYHRPGWEAIAREIATERRLREQNAKVVLKEKHMNAGSTHYTFSVVQTRNSKPYLRVNMDSEKMNYRGTIVVFAPYVPAFLGILQKLSKEFDA